MNQRTQTVDEHDRHNDWQCRRLDSWATCSLVLIAALLSTSVLRVVQLKLWPDDRLAAATGTLVSSMREPGRRGDLFDRRGRLIATTTLGYRAYLDPAEVEDLGTIAIDIEQLIGLNPLATDRALEPRLDTRYVPISGILEPWQVDQLQQSTLRGVGIEPRLVRNYPHGQIGQQLIGAVGFEHTGLGGLEHVLDTSLNYKDGKLTYTRDVNRRPLWIQPGDYTPHRDGANHTLTIDIVLQQFAEQRLNQEVMQRNASGGRLVVLDPSTGELLAIAEAVNHEQLERPDALVQHAPSHPRLTRARSGSDPYEPGSTFKPFVWAGATESGVVTPDEILPTPTGTPHRTNGGRRIRDVHYYGPSSWQKVLVKSMNSGMAIVAERLSHAQMRHIVARFGFGQKTNCGLPGETAGLVTTPEKWSDYSQVSVGMGHEIGVTPLQMVRAFSVFCSEGKMPALRLLSPDRVADTLAVPIQHQVLDPAVANLTRQTMRMVMTEGTGRKSQSTQYQLFGKSGTAQLPRAQGGGYHEDRYVSSFIAGAPLAAPRLVVLCVIEDPDKRRGPYYGGLVAGPVVRDVMDFALPYLGVTSDIESPLALAD
jgi:cell division protein FtsI (penicillin-binding protein 3)